MIETQLYQERSPSRTQENLETMGAPVEKGLEGPI